LALEGSNEPDRAELESLAGEKELNEQTIHRIRRLYQSAGVFEKASRLVDKYQERAEAVADEVASEELRRLLYYLVDTVLERGASEPAPQVVMPALSIAGAAAAP
jgi:geranylgeranyl pyrophosphate synthase